MNVFTPYPSAYRTASVLDGARLRKGIVEAGQILSALNGASSWSNHPCVLEYRGHEEWLRGYQDCLRAYSKENYAEALDCEIRIRDLRPDFLTEDFCKNMRRRLWTKKPDWYGRYFEELEPTEENWYFVDGEMRVYVKGKRIER